MEKSGSKEILGYEGLKIGRPASTKVVEVSLSLKDLVLTMRSPKQVKRRQDEDGPDNRTHDRA
jgi:hypothetical protein